MGQQGVGVRGEREYRGRGEMGGRGEGEGGSKQRVLARRVPPAPSRTRYPAPQSPSLRSDLQSCARTCAGLTRINLMAAGSAYSEPVLRVKSGWALSRRIAAGLDRAAGARIFPPVPTRHAARRPRGLEPGHDTCVRRGDYSPGL